LAATPQPDSKTENPELNPAIGLSELVGGQWGWRLETYRAFDGAFKIDGKVFLLLSTDMRAESSVLWDPLSGEIRRFDHTQYLRFWSEHKPDFIWSSVSEFSTFSIRLPDDRRLQSIPSPGQAFSCHSLVFQYFAVVGKQGKTEPAFYIIRKLGHLRQVKYVSCPEAEESKEHHMQIRFVMDFNNAIALPDETTLFLGGILANRLTIIRLDRNFKPHTTLGGRVLVVDANQINNRLRPAADDGAFYTSFVGALNDVGLATPSDATEPR
jgi:hypothetical protein